jgi:hypothetical protein
MGLAMQKEVQPLRHDRRTFLVEKKALKIHIHECYRRGKRKRNPKRKEQYYIGNFNLEGE